MAYFCSKCGTPLDVNTGVCPNCNPITETKIEEPKVQEPVYKETEPLTAWMPEEQVVTQGQTEKKSKKKNGKGKTLFLTILFSILFFVTSIVTVLVCTARNTVKEENIEEVISEVDMDDLFDAFADITGRDVSFEDEADVINEYMYEGEMTSKDVESFLEDADVQKFLVEKITTYINDVCMNDDDFSLDEKDIEDFINDNYKEFADAADYDFSNEEIKEISYRLIDTEAVEKFYPEELKDDQPALYTTLQVLLSHFVMVVAEVLAVLLIVVLLKNNVSQGFAGIGIVLTIQGGLLTVAALIAKFAPNVIGDIAGNALVELLGTRLFAVNLLFYSVILTVGVLILVVRMLICKAIAKKSQKQSV